MRTNKNPSDEEYEVYSVALRKVHPVKEGRLIVLDERTSSNRLFDMRNRKLLRQLGIKDRKRIVASGFPDISNETVEQFIKNNQTGGVLEAKLRLEGASQKVLTEAEHRGLFGVWVKG